MLILLINFILGAGAGFCLGLLYCLRRVKKVQDKTKLLLEDTEYNPYRVLGRTDVVAELLGINE